MFIVRKCSSVCLRIVLFEYRAESTLAQQLKGALEGVEINKTEAEQKAKLESEKDEKGDPFRKFFVMPDRMLRTRSEILRLTGRETRITKPRMDSLERRAVRRPRSEEMETDQDWPSVWPVAASFRSSVVPIPVRMGTRRFPEKKPPFKTVGNLELVKIPNFLHLAPSAIERHCKAIKKFCTEWPVELNDSVSLPETNYPVTISFSDYVHQGTSLRDTRSRIITLKLKLSSLNLKQAAKEKMLRLVGDRYCRETDMLTLTTDRCYTRKQNLDYAMYLLTALYHESNKAETWDALMQRKDDLKVYFEGSKSQKNITDIANRITNSLSQDDPNVPVNVRDVNKKPVDERVASFGKVWEKYRNEKETFENVDRYAEAVRNLLAIPSVESKPDSKNR